MVNWELKLSFNQINMKRMLFFAGVWLLSCTDHPVGEVPGLVLNNRMPVIGNHPTQVAGTYILDKATLQGSKIEVIHGSNPPIVAEYTHDADITVMVSKILFGGSAFSAFQSACHSSQFGIEFKVNGKTSYVCLGSSFETMDMGTWNTTGADNSLLAWSILNYARAIECEIVPFEVNLEMLSGYVVFPLPKNDAAPLMEGNNLQYRKIMITFKRLH